MNIQLSSIEARILGCLLEKEITTPDQYPLSLNSLAIACNQKTARDPVLELKDSELQEALDGLAKRFLVSDKAGYGGGRTPKYKHRFCNIQYGALKFLPQELAVVCVLLLRGPETPGELRQHTQRLCEFADVGEVERTLIDLMNRDDGPFVARLARAPGAREHRYAHLFSGEIDSVAELQQERSAGPLAERVAILEALVAELRREIDERFKPATAVDHQTSLGSS
ncbi:MAG: DUF480 domain-containing protein [Gammaproteobacteria bacterium]|nr:DUF480 domain-containing protein [Gammaproteobacteria bacterium]